MARWRYYTSNSEIIRADGFEACIAVADDMQRERHDGELPTSIGLLDLFQVERLRFRDNA